MARGVQPANVDDVPGWGLADTQVWCRSASKLGAVHFVGIMTKSCCGCPQPPLSLHKERNLLSPPPPSTLDGKVLGGP